MFSSEAEYKAQSMFQGESRGNTLSAWRDSLGTRTLSADMGPEASTHHALSHRLVVHLLSSANRNKCLKQTQSATRDAVDLNLDAAIACKQVARNELSVSVLLIV